MTVVRDLPALAVTGRLDRLRAGFSAAGCDALLVTDLTNIRWLTGFTGSAGRLLVTATSALLVTDGRYTAQARAQLDASGADVGLEIRSAEQLELLARAAGPVARLGLEAASITWAEQRAVAAAFGAGVEPVPTDGLVERLRMVKDDAEVARMGAAAAAADAALAAVVPTIVAGVTEREIALGLEVAMRHAGAAGPAYETIVASGPNAALPHARPTDRRLEQGDLLIIDVGSVVDGYRSDMTRTFVLGEPTAEQRRLLDAVTEAQALGVAAVAEGVALREVDRVCREHLVGLGLGEAFSHGTGHGVGLVIHEEPRVNDRATGTLAPGHVVTVEPGVYLPGVGGVRVEDLVVVTATGCRPLTSSPKQPILG
jgi:Xaa-Pro aminopeptidase